MKARPHSPNVEYPDVEEPVARVGGYGAHRPSMLRSVMNSQQSGAGHITYFLTSHLA